MFLRLRDLASAIHRGNIFSQGECGNNPLVLSKKPAKSKPLHLSGCFQHGRGEVMQPVHVMQLLGFVTIDHALDVFF